MPKIHRDRPPTNRYDVQVSAPEPEPEAPPLPARLDRKELWVAYAEAIGIDASGTKTEIVERVRNG